MPTSYASLLGVLSAAVTSVAFASCVVPADVPAESSTPEPAALVEDRDVVVYRVRKELRIDEEAPSVTEDVELALVRHRGGLLLSDFWLESVALLGRLTPDEQEQLVFPALDEDILAHGTQLTCALPGTGRVLGLSGGAPAFGCRPSTETLPEGVRRFERTVDPASCDGDVCAVTWTHRGEFTELGRPTQYTLTGRGDYDARSGRYLSAEIVTTVHGRRSRRREHVHLTYDADLSAALREARDEADARRREARETYDDWLIANPGEGEARAAARDTQESLDSALRHFGRACNFSSPGLMFHAEAHPDAVWETALSLPPGPGRGYVVTSAWDAQVQAGLRVPDAVAARLAELSGQSDEMARTVAGIQDPRFAATQRRLLTHEDERVREWAAASLGESAPTAMGRHEPWSLGWEAASVHGEGLSPFLRRVVRGAATESAPAVQRRWLEAFSNVVFTRIHSVDDARAFLSANPSLDRHARAVAALDDPTFESGALQFLAQRPERPGVRALFEARLRHRDVHLRFLAARTLLAWGDGAGALALAELLEAGWIEPARVVSSLAELGSTLGLLDYEQRDEAIGRFREWAERYAASR